MPAADLTPYYQPSGTVADGTKFDNALAYLQSLLNGLDNNNLAALAGIVWTKFSPKITYSLYSAGPPGSPADGDIWIALAVDTGNLATTNGTIWQFRFNSSSGSASKWEFFGGTPLIAEVNTREFTASGSFVDLATVGPSITLARAGDYNVSWGVTVDTDSAPNNSSAEVGVNVAGQITNTARAAWGEAVQYNAQSVSRSKTYSGVAAASLVKLQYRTMNALRADFAGRFLNILPVRIS